jgi:hypothetical protein
VPAAVDAAAAGAALLPLGLLEVEHLDLATQPGRVGLQQLDLVEELDQTLALQLRFERRHAVLELLLQLGDALVGRLDALAGFLVVEQGRARGRRGQRRQQQRRREHAGGKARGRHSPT